MNYVGIFQLAGGLGLFLFGMKLMGDGLELAAGSRLRRLLEILTSNKYFGAFIGLIITTVIQSSSATTVMVVGFVNAGLMNLSQAVGVIMGANIGTTITGVLITLKIGDIAPVVVFAGVVLYMFMKKKNLQNIGMILTGFGVLFMGMNIMSAAMAPLSDDPSIRLLFEYAKNPVIGILVGTIFTAVIQSSSASIGVLLALTMAGVVTDLRQAVFILYGQNIGTCITAILASIGAKKTAKRAAIIHLLFNLIGTTLFVGITLLPLGNYSFVNIIERLFPTTEAQIAGTHVIFNIVTTVLLLPLSEWLVKLSCKILPGEEPLRESVQFKFIDSRLLSTPSIAVAQVLNEVGRMAKIAVDNFSLSIKSFMKPNKETNETVASNELVVNFLNHNITEYLVQINTLELKESDNKLLGSMFHVVNDIERIGDHAENIIEYAEQFNGDKPPFSEDAIVELADMTAKVQLILDDVISLFDSKKTDIGCCDRIIKAEEEIDVLNRTFRNNHVKRLNTRGCSSEGGVIFVEMLSNLERVSDHAANIAFAFKENS